jgi:mono/diheme cytochrome c family protein
MGKDGSRAIGITLPVDSSVLGICPSRGRSRLKGRYRFWRPLTLQLFVRADEGNRGGVRKRVLVSRGGCALAALSCGFSLWVKAAEIAPMPVLEGSAAYRVNCANCHGENLSGGYGPSLRDMAFRTKWTSLGPAALREFLSTRMPPSDPGGLAQDMYEQIATFIEQTSGIATTPPPAKQNESTTEPTDPARPSDRRGV